ncbi:MAG: twin-arginine translocase TatA/TatE family subunit [Alphaproteobacteria bacterium]|nr:twin-arginine translocase TatA/TatE family subunit [Alphaproteobacteria bacterium]
MGAFSIWHWVIVLVVVLVLFGGKGKISSLMGDFGKGLKSFKKSVKEDDGAVTEGSAKSIETESMRDGAAEQAASAKDSTAKS